MEMMPIPGCPGYFATADGHVYSEKSDRVLAERVSRLGYKRVNLSLSGVHCTREVHQLVMEAWKGEAESGYRILHGPGGIHDNRPENLRYGTQYDNMQDKKRDGTDPKGSRNPSAKMDEEKVLELRKDWAEGAWSSQREAAEYFGISPRTISSILQGKLWTHV